jgi:outer membrane protein OmpA-like peptidoglycan-associated protein/thiol-disulfide isomerase/thioredoxin
MVGLLFFSVINISEAQQKAGINFEKGKWQKILEKAKKENKLIFFDCYTSWCGPCKWMDQHVFNNDTVIEFYNSNFICVKMDMEKGEGFDLAKRYTLKSYPSFLYLNHNGEVLHRRSGKMNPAGIIAIGKEALDPDKRLASYAGLFLKNNSDSKVAFSYFKLLGEAGLIDNQMIEKYFLSQSDSSLMTSYNWKIIYSFSSYQSREFNYLESHKEAFSKLYGKDSVEEKINWIYSSMLNFAHEHKNKKDFELLKNKLLRLNTKDAGKIIQRAELNLQNLPYNDMKNALMVKDSIIGPVNVCKGYGTINDNGWEENSIWFKLNIQTDTLLTFDIVPIDSLDDYDFSVYKCSGPDCLKKVNTRRVLADRRCDSYCTSKSGITGLSAYTSAKQIGRGFGPAYVAGIPAKAGEVYYIAVNYAEMYIKKLQIPFGFTIYFYNYWPKRNAVALNQVYFENNKAILSKKSFFELDKLASTLSKNEMVIEIRGHTDDLGNETDNQNLSEKRAKVIVDYLISKKINPTRLFYKGYGSTKPIATNETEEGRKKNRRVEFFIVMY